VNIIELEKINKEYYTKDGSFTALKDITFCIQEGECVILRGISGSGKTTLLSILAGLDRPTSGKITVDGEDIAKLPDIHLSHFRGHHIGMVFQHYNLLEHLSVTENIITPLIPMKITPQEAYKRAKEKMEIANISHKADMDTNRLSGGEKQRVAIARALIADPKIILCDEPTANLDRANAKRFTDIIKKLIDIGKTVVIATHDPLFWESDLDIRIIDIEDAKIVADSKVEV